VRAGLTLLDDFTAYIAVNSSRHPVGRRDDARVDQPSVVLGA
jgi:hypothetical protein